MYSTCTVHVQYMYNMLHVKHMYSIYMYVCCIYVTSGAYEPPKAARSVQLRRTALAFTRI